MKDQVHGTSGGDTAQAAGRVPLMHEFLLTELGESWSPVQVKTALQMLDGGKLRFPPGARVLPPGLVGVVQRARLISAMLEAVAEHGWRDVTIDEVVVRCNVTRTTFYAHFSNMEELYLLCLDSVVTHVQTRLAIALPNGAGSLPDTFRLSLTELMRFVSEEPDAARALIVDARCSFPDAAMRRDALLEQLEKCIHVQIRSERVADAPKITPSGIVGGVASLLYTRIVKGETDGLDALVPQMVYLALVPYIGHDAALAEMNRIQSS